MDEKGGSVVVQEQGNLIYIEELKQEVLVVSTKFFNQSGQVIVCPIVHEIYADPLHIDIISEDIRKIVMCEQMKLMDLRNRKYKKVGQLTHEEMLNITDAIQAIFDC